MNAYTPTLLLILDGWGLAPAGPGNAVTLADTPTLDRLLQHPSFTSIEASGRAVGLPAGYMGNSEVGHMNLGAGRTVYQDMTLIDVAIENGDFAHNPVITELLEKTHAAGGRVHFMGLLSDGGVHTHINHAKALLAMAKSAAVPAVLHAFMDGRDTSPTSGVHFIEDITAYMASIHHGALGTMTGRYYAMDRDKHWERLSVAWNAIVHGVGQRVSDPVAALKAAYAAEEFDEFLKPRVIDTPGFSPCIADNDSIFFFNFRADRARQLCQAFYNQNFSDFERGAVPKLSAFATMTPYDSALPLPAAFIKPSLSNSLGEVVASLHLRQLRIAETEKYAHVTYFFSCGREEEFPGETRCLIPSPREVATYDLAPAMSVEKVADTFIQEWKTGAYHFAVCNLANPDMVGHTGIIPAAVAACEAVDAAVKRIIEVVLSGGGRVVMTADHGNAEEMIDAQGKPQTAHTTNPVALVVLDDGPVKKLKRGGKLGDVAPTILQMWGVPIPVEMTGDSLLETP